ncbi:MAG: AraC family transcriptional regulator [Kiritimatiellae bacterium]|nr:AraC family transcriptional regulator [Kiritimatiellia bacterium]
MRTDNRRAPKIAVSRAAELDALAAKLCAEATLLEATCYDKPAMEVVSYLHLHPDVLHITYTVAGKGVCERGNAKDPLKPGFVHIIYPNEPHAFVPDRVDPYRNLNLKIHFEGTLPQGFPRTLSVGGRRAAIESLLRQLVELAEAVEGRVRRLRERGTLLLLFAELVALCEEQHLRKLSESVDASPSAFAGVLSELQRPPFRFPGLTQMAKACHMSRRAFTAFFREVTGMSPLRFANAARLSHANRLLRSGEHSVKDIARRCGYSGSQSFIKAYSTRFGISPGRAAGRASPPG